MRIVGAHDITSSPYDKACIVHNPSILADGIIGSDIYSSMCPKSNWWTGKHNLYRILSATSASHYITLKLFKLA